MKVFIIGPEGSGKTVFATMLYYYVQKIGNELIFRASDIKTKKYFSEVLFALEQGDWPSSTLGGSLISLNWEWIFQKETTSITLIDPPGQDIRSEFNGESSNLEIINKIKEADLLILIIDLYGHQISDRNKKNENAWIVEKTINLSSKNQFLIIGLSKADLIQNFKESMWNDKKSLINIFQRYMPDFNSAGYSEILNNDAYKILAFSSVSTQDIILDNKLIRIPKKPLNSLGFENFTNIILELLHECKVKKQEELNMTKNLVTQQKLEVVKNIELKKVKEKKVFISKLINYIGAIFIISCFGNEIGSGVGCFFGILFGVGLGYFLNLYIKNVIGSICTIILIGVFLLIISPKYEKCNMCNGFGKVYCSNCNGNGVYGLIIKDKCPACDGKGIIICSYCNGQGKVIKK